MTAVLDAAEDDGDPFAPADAHIDKHPECAAWFVGFFGALREFAAYVADHPMTAAELEACAAGEWSPRLLALMQDVREVASDREQAARRICATDLWLLRIRLGRGLS